MRLCSQAPGISPSRSRDFGQSARRGGRARSVSEPMPRALAASHGPSQHGRTRSAPLRPPRQIGRRRSQTIVKWQGAFEMRPPRHGRFFSSWGEKGVPVLESGASLLIDEPGGGSGKTEAGIALGPRSARPRKKSAQPEPKRCSTLLIRAQVATSSASVALSRSGPRKRMVLGGCRPC